MSHVRDYSHLIGHAFSSGRYRLAPYEAWLWDDAVMSSHDEPMAHPGIAYMIGLRGGGGSIQEVLRLLEASHDSGVLMGSLGFDIQGPIEPGRTFLVDGRITSVERKESRRIGAFDLVGFEHRIILESDQRTSRSELVAVVRHAWLIPRPGGL